LNHNLLSEEANKNNKVGLRKELNKELYEIKQDLFNNTLDSKSKYHKWINTHRPNIFPKEFTESYEFDLEHIPQKYMKSMIYMCIVLEKNESKSFQFFPIRSNIVLKYIPIDTASLIDIFIKDNKNEYFKDIDGCKDQLWSEFFNTSDPIFKQKNYQFDHRILTDGFAISIQLINNNNLEKEKGKKDNMKRARQEAKKLYKDLDQDEIEKIKNQKKINEKNHKMLNKLALKNERDKKREIFKKLSKEDQKIQRNKIKQ